MFLGIDEGLPMAPMEMAARQILQAAPGVPTFVSARWVDAAGVDWVGLEEWLNTKGSVLGDDERRLIAACIALAHVHFGELGPLDAEAVGRSLHAVASAYRDSATPDLERMRAYGVLD